MLPRDIKFFSDDQQIEEIIYAGRHTKTANAHNVSV